MYYDILLGSKPEIQEYLLTTIQLSSTYFRGGVSFQIIIIRKFQILLNVGIYCDKTFMHYKTSPKYYML